MGYKKQLITVYIIPLVTIMKRRLYEKIIIRCRNNDHNRVWCMIGDFNAIQN